jgi:hypothetical protein
MPEVSVHTSVTPGSEFPYLPCQHLRSLTGHPLRDAIHQKQSGCVTSVNYMVVFDAIINYNLLVSIREVRFLIKINALVFIK